MVNSSFQIFLVKISFWKWKEILILELFRIHEIIRILWPIFSWITPEKITELRKTKTKRNDFMLSLLIWYPCSMTDFPRMKKKTSNRSETIVAHLLYRTFRLKFDFSVVQCWWIGVKIDRWVNENIGDLPINIVCREFLVNVSFRLWTERTVDSVTKSLRPALNSAVSRRFVTYKKKLSLFFTSFDRVYRTRSEVRQEFLSDDNREKFEF